MRHSTLLLFATVAAASGCNRSADRPAVAPPIAPAVTPGTTAVVAFPDVGDAFPATTVATLGPDSATVGGSELQPITLVNLWSTTCVPCKREFPDLQAIHDRYATRGLRLLAISSDATDAPVQKYIMETGSTFTIGRDPSKAVLAHLDARGAQPWTILVARDGRILYKSMSLVGNRDSRLTTAIETALASR